MAKNQKMTEDKQVMPEMENMMGLFSNFTKKADDFVEKQKSKEKSTKKFNNGGSVMSGRGTKFTGIF